MPYTCMHGHNIISSPTWLDFGGNFSSFCQQGSISRLGQPAPHSCSIKDINRWYQWLTSAIEMVHMYILLRLMFIFFTIHYEILETEILESLQTQKSPSVPNGLRTMSCNRQYSNLPAWMTTAALVLSLLILLRWTRDSQPLTTAHKPYT